MTMEAILVFFQFFLAGWVSCHFYMAYKMRNQLKKVAEENGMSLDELADAIMSSAGVEARVTKVPNLFTEITRNSILLYNKDTGDFVCQAEDLDRLAKSTFEYNKIKYALVKHDDTQIWFVEGKVQKDLQNI